MPNAIAFYRRGLPRDPLRPTGMSESLIEAKIRAGTFPRPNQASERRVAWLVREIEEWAEKLPVSELQPTANTVRHNQPR